MKKRNGVKLLMYVLSIALLLSATLLATSCSSSAGFEYTLSAEDGGFIISKYNGRAANVVIPEEYSGLPVFAVADSVFEGNTRLKSVTVPASVKSLGIKAFASCPKLKTVTLPEKLDSIGFGCFSECTSLESIVIPEGVTELVSAEFLKCSALKSVTLPSTLKSVFYSAFMNCESLAEIKMNGKNKTFNAIDNCLIDVEKKELVIGTTKSKIPTDGSVTAIGTGAFYNRTGLTEIIIPESVDTVGEVAFYGCSSLKAIQVLGASRIGIRAFFGCSSASYAILSDKLINVEDFALLQCTSLKNVYFEGDSAAWEKVEISESNGAILDKVPVSFYSEKAPAGEGEFWHFGEDGKPTLWN